MGELLGYRTWGDLTFLGLGLGDDEEYVLFAMIYWDGSELRGFIPVEGNVLNKSRDCSYRNFDWDEQTLHDFTTRFPEQANFTPEEEEHILGNGLSLEGPIQAHEGAIRAEILRRLRKKNT